MFGLSVRDANAYCRTTTSKDARGGACVSQGVPLFWRSACIGYSLQRDGSHSLPFSAVAEAVDRSFDAWNQVKCGGGGDLGIEFSNLGPVACRSPGYVERAANQNVVLFYDENWPYGVSTLALTTVSHNARTGEIFDADIEVNATASLLSVSDSSAGSAYDLQSVITHEVGHFLGLAHSSDPNASMIEEYTKGTLTLRSLAADDSAGACAIYPNAQQRSVDKSVSPSGWAEAGACDATPRGGFSSECAVSAPEPVRPQTTSRCDVGGVGLVTIRGAASVGWMCASAALLRAVRRWRRTGQSRASTPQPRGACANARAGFVFR